MKFIFPGLFFILLVGCGSDRETSNSLGSPVVDNVASASTSAVDVQLDLLDAFGQKVSLFSQREEIFLRLTLTNPSSQSITLRFSSAQQYDFHIEDADENELWRWSEDQFFTQAETELVLASNASTQVQVAWDQQVLDGVALQVGIYQALGAWQDLLPIGSSTLTVQ